MGISGHYSKLVGDLYGKKLDLVITVCSQAHERCPFFPGSTKVIHHGFNDPLKLAEQSSNEKEALEHYRRVRDEIREFVTTLPELLYRL